MEKDKSQEPRQVTVENLPWNFHKKQIKDAFRACGQIRSVHLHKRWIGKATITFQHRTDVSHAVDMYDGGSVGNRKIRVQRVSDN